MRVTVSQAVSAKTERQGGIRDKEGHQHGAPFGEQRRDIEGGVHRSDGPATRREIAPGDCRAVASRASRRLASRRVRREEVRRQPRPGRHRARVRRREHAAVGGRNDSLGRLHPGVGLACPVEDIEDLPDVLAHDGIGERRCEPVQVDRCEVGEMPRLRLLRAGSAPAR